MKRGFRLFSAVRRADVTHPDIRAATTGVDRTGVCSRPFSVCASRVLILENRICSKVVKCRSNVVARTRCVEYLGKISPPCPQIKITVIVQTRSRTINVSEFGTYGTTSFQKIVIDFGRKKNEYLPSLSTRRVYGLRV